MGLSPQKTSVWCLSLKLSSCIPFLEYALDLSQLLIGFEESHMVHCDIKTANVLIGGNPTEGKGFAVFCDFGAAHRFPDGHRSVKIDVGTTCYQAAESLACFDAFSKEDWGSEASAASDMHSYALMLAEILVPFSDVISVKCPELVDMLARCLCIHPCMRPTALEMSVTLKACLSSLRAAEQQWRQEVPDMLDSAQLDEPQRSMHLMRHLLAYIEIRHALKSAVMYPEFVDNVDTATLWLAYDAVGCGNQLNDFVWSVACEQLGVAQATVRLQGWDDLVAHEDSVMIALRERFLRELMPATVTMQQAKDTWPEEFKLAYRETQIAFGAAII